MIVIKNLVKEYKSQNKEKTIALNNINISFPDKGMIFIIGKSGSGKSTLLNIIGGLDKATSGEVIFDGMDIVKLNTNKTEDYRNNHIGFIFQYYNLIPLLNIEENIKISQNATNNYQYDINTLLTDIGLSGYNNKYPHELSGGEKQRVGILRAIIKNSKIILADEPTGNLDNLNSKIILDLLQKVSKHRLVIIVSHSMADATLYADRIIRLQEGEIIEDIIRYNYRSYDMYLDNNTLYLPNYRDLNNEETKELENYFINKNIDNIVQQDTGFIPNNIELTNTNKASLKNNKLNIKAFIKYLSIFFKKSTLNRIVHIILTVLVLLVITVLSSLNREEYLNVKYDSDEPYAILSNSPLSFNTEYRSMYVNLTYPISDENIKNIYNNGYNGKAYKLYNHAFYSIVIEDNSLINDSTVNFSKAISEFYLKTNLGVLEVDEEFINKNLSINNKLDFLIGETKPNGIIITDYLADSIIAHYPSYTYSSLIADKFHCAANYSFSATITGIINTNYKEKYNNLIAIYNQCNKTATEDKFTSLASKENNYEEFLSDVLYRYSIGYTIDTNYEEYVKQNNYNTVISTNLRGFRCIVDNQSICINDLFSKYNELNNDELILSYPIYNSIFNTSYNPNNLSLFEPHKIRLIKEDSEGNYIFDKEYLITKLGIDNYFSKKEYDEICLNKLCAYSLYIEKDEITNDVYKYLSNSPFTFRTIDSENATAVSSIVSVFKPFYTFILIALYVFLIILIITYSFQAVKNNYYELGVLSSMGIKKKYFSRIFIIDTIITLLGTIILSIIFYPFISTISNNSLKDSFYSMTNVLFYDIEIIKINYLLLFRGLGIIILVSLIFSIIINIFIRRLKPINLILNSKVD